MFVPNYAYLGFTVDREHRHLGFVAFVRRWLISLGHLISISRLLVSLVNFLMLLCIRWYWCALNSATIVSLRVLNVPPLERVVHWMWFGIEIGLTLYKTILSLALLSLEHLS